MVLTLHLIDYLYDAELKLRKYIQLEFCRHLFLNHWFSYYWKGQWCLDPASYMCNSWIHICSLSLKFYLEAALLHSHSECSTVTFKCISFKICFMFWHSSLDHLFFSLFSLFNFLELLFIWSPLYYDLIFPYFLFS